MATRAVTALAVAYGRLFATPPPRSRKALIAALATTHPSTAATRQAAARLRQAIAQSGFDYDAFVRAVKEHASTRAPRITPGSQRVANRLAGVGTHRGAMAARMATYAAQDRGSVASYSRIATSMAKGLQQKICQASAFLPTTGKVGDAGCADGVITHALGAMYPNVQFTGLEVDRVHVATARQKHQRPNVDYLHCDATAMIGPPESFDAFFCCSTGHHFYSFNEDSLDALRTCFSRWRTMLKFGGVIIHRDSCSPDGPPTVFMDLPTRGATSGHPSVLSKAALFELFPSVFRTAEGRMRPVPFERLPSSPHPGFARFKVSLENAFEFQRRMHWVEGDDFRIEGLEKQGYWRQAQGVAEFERLHMSVVALPSWNDWMKEHQQRDQYYWYSEDGERLPYPAQNLLLVAEKTPEHQGIRIREADSRPAASRFLKRRVFKHRETGELRELIERPNQAVNPFITFDQGDASYVLTRHRFPRPLLAADSTSANIDGGTMPGYLTEPITVTLPSTKFEAGDVLEILRHQVGIDANRVRAVGAALRYFTNPGGLNECVLARWVDVDPLVGDLAPPRNDTAFSTAGVLRPIEATQLLRACQVGGMLDARLEINTYMMLLDRQRALGPWIGAELSPELQDLDPHQLTGAFAALAGQKRASFDEIDAKHAPGFYENRVGSFEEVDGAGRVLHTAEFEYFRPSAVSCNTLVTLPFAKTEHGIVVRLEERDDLPAAQLYSGSSSLTTVPAFRVGREVKHLDAVELAAPRLLERDFGLTTRRLTLLGGKYRPAAGATPEEAYVLALEMDVGSLRQQPGPVVRLRDAIANRHLIQDAHSLLALFRLAHAAGEI